MRTSVPERRDHLGTARRTDVGGEDHVDALPFEVLGDDGGGLEVLVGMVEIVQDGLLVYVHGDDAVTVHIQMLAHHLGRFRLSGFEDPVLPGVPEIGDDQRDGLRTEPPHRILQEEEFDELAVRGRGLDDDDVVVQFLRVDPGVALPVGECRSSRLNVVAAHDAGKFLCQIHGCGPAYHYHGYGLFVPIFYMFADARDNLCRTATWEQI